MITSPTKINSIDELRSLTIDKTFDGFILFGGIARSSKSLEYDTDLKHWMIINEIDDTWKEMTELEFQNSTIAFAINKGSFYSY